VVSYEGIGGGAAVWSHLTCLISRHHHVGSILGGHIRTQQKRYPNQSECDEILENGVLEFPLAFLALMQELGVELEPVDIGSALF